MKGSAGRTRIGSGESGAKNPRSETSTAKFCVDLYWADTPSIPASLRGTLDTTIPAASGIEGEKIVVGQRRLGWNTVFRRAGVEPEQVYGDGVFGVGGRRDTERGKRC
jgi:hypothetical protein